MTPPIFNPSYTLSPPPSPTTPTPPESHPSSSDLSLQPTHPYASPLTTGQRKYSIYEPLVEQGEGGGGATLKRSVASWDLWFDSEVELEALSQEGRRT